MTPIVLNDANVFNKSTNLYSVRGSGPAWSQCYIHTWCPGRSGHSGHLHSYIHLNPPLSCRLWKKKPQGNIRRTIWFTNNNNNNNNRKGQYLGCNWEKMGGNPAPRQTLSLGASHKDDWTYLRDKNSHGLNPELKNNFDTRQINLSCFFFPHLSLWRDTCYTLDPIHGRSNNSTQSRSPPCRF